jgi:GT2 family glycosyltransferase
VENFIPIHALLFRRTVLSGPTPCRFDEQLDLYEDWDFWLQLLERGTFHHRNAVSACYRIHDVGSLIKASGHQMYAAFQAIVRKWRGRWSDHQLIEMMIRAQIREPTLPGAIEPRSTVPGNDVAQCLQITHQFIIEAPTKVHIQTPPAPVLHNKCNSARQATLPLIHLLITLPASDSTRLGSTLISLAQQTLAAWRLTVIADFACPSQEFAQMDELSWVHISAWDKLSDILAEQVRQSPAKWFFCGQAGVRLEPAFINLAVESISRHPEWRLVYTDEDVTGQGLDQESLTQLLFKPDPNLDLLRSSDYVGHAVLVHRELWESLPAVELRPGLLLNYAAALRCFEQFGEAAVGHIDEMVFHQPEAAPVDWQAFGQDALPLLKDHLQRQNLAATISAGPLPGTFQLHYLESVLNKLSISARNLPIRSNFSNCVSKSKESYCRSDYQGLIIRTPNRNLAKHRICCTIANHECNDNSILLAQYFSEYFDTIIIDSGSICPPEKSLHLKNIYYSGLLNFAYNISRKEKYDKLFFICSDVVFTYEQIEILVAKLENFDFSEIGVYSPSSTGRSFIFCKKEIGYGIKAVPFIEGFIFIAKLNILEQLLPVHMAINKYGWGLDFAMGFFAKYRNLLCVVDEDISVYHPQKTGYLNDNARGAMDQWLKNFKDSPFYEFINFGIENYISYWNEDNKISVIIPCYNVGVFVKEAVMSVLLQYFPQVEILIIDDGSTDETEMISRELCNKYSQIQYTKKKNGGVSSSRNVGLSMATGKYIQFLDGDDFISKNKFMSQIQSMKQTGSDISISDYLCFHHPNRDSTFKNCRSRFQGDPLLDLIDNWEKDLSIPIHCFMFKKTVIDGIYFDESLPNHEDWDFHLKIAHRNPSYSYDDTSKAYYRIRGGSLCRDKKLMLYGLSLCMQRAIDSGYLHGCYLNHMRIRLTREQSLHIKSLEKDFGSLKNKFIIKSPILSNIDTSQSAVSKLVPCRTVLIDVIIPVYRGLVETRACLTSVLRNPQSVPHEIIVIDDASPEPALSAYLLDLARTEKITLLRNPQNLGFVQTVNRGMVLHQERDVVLLNSDTEVAGDWLDRLTQCAYGDPQTGTVTPFSNNATICSYPQTCANNVLPPGYTVEALDALFRRVNAGQSITIPTAVGFCMYIRRDCLRAVGPFDATHFGRGYGEENDFCMRAAALGWHHLLCGDVFVYHHGSVSFDDPHDLLEQQGTATVRRLHPGYDIAVQRHIAADPARPLRQAVDAARLLDSHLPIVLFVNHHCGGGTLKHVRELAALLSERMQTLLLCPITDHIHTLSWLRVGEILELRFALPADYSLLCEVLRTLRVSRIHFHHLLDVDTSVWRLPQDLSVPYDYTLHDYYPICPRIKMFHAPGHYCGEPDESGCNHCLHTTEL